MKRTVYKGFSKNEKITVETTGYKDVWGAAVWVGEDGMTYDLQYARRSKTWAATPKRYEMFTGDTACLIADFSV